MGTIKAIRSALVIVGVLSLTACALTENTCPLAALDGEREHWGLNCEFPDSDKPDSSPSRVDKGKAE